MKEFKNLIEFVTRHNKHFYPKDALLAEIDNLLKPVKQRLERDKNDPWDSDIAVYKFGKQLTKNIDTLEMKEVDLDYIKDELDKVVKIYKPDGDFGWGTLYNVATHFFELGMAVNNKVQKGEDA